MSVNARDFWSVRVETARGAEAGAIMQVRVGWSAHDELANERERLLAEHRHPAPCLTTEAFDALRDVAGELVTPVFATLVQDGRVVAIFALQESRLFGMRTIQWLGRDLLPRHEPLVTLEGMRIDAAAAMRALGEWAGGASIIDLGGLRPASRGTRWLTEALTESAGWYDVAGPGESEVRLAGGWPRVEASLAASLRRRAESGARLARGRGGLALETRVASRSCELDALFALDPIAPPSHEGLELVRVFIERSLAAGVVRITTMRHGGRVVAASATWVRARQAVELLTATAPDLAVLHPRDVLLHRLLRHLSEAEQLDAYLLRPGHRLDAALPPIPQPGAIGVPGAPSTRVVAAAAAWLLERHAARARLSAQRPATSPPSEVPAAPANDLVVASNGADLASANPLAPVQPSEEPAGILVER